MKPATLEFVKQRFADYYQRQNLTVPSSLEQREWGFVFFDAAAEVRMRRHMAFADPLELGAYVKNLVPAHVYYSTAYYQTPSAPTMNEKHWAGADLIFDLDADQIVRGPYAMMLARVKEETEKLLGMLTDELGFARNHIRIAFSGGRGYHIHVTDIAVRGWGSQERREIVDYVCGIGLDPGVMLAPGAARPSQTEGLTGRAPKVPAPGGGGATRKPSGLTSPGLRVSARRRRRPTLRGSKVSASGRLRSSSRTSMPSWRKSRGTSSRTGSSGRSRPHPTSKRGSGTPGRVRTSRSRPISSG